jgi:hypothetical protein
MDPDVTYRLGSTYHNYSKKDYYEKHPFYYMFSLGSHGIFPIYDKNDPNPDQGNGQKELDDANATIIIMTLSDGFGELFEGGELGANAGRALKAGKMGEIIGWGTGQEGVEQTIELTENLTEEQVEIMKSRGITKQFIEEQLAKYNKAIEKAGIKLNNLQLKPRKELMEKILQLWK